MEKKMKKEKNPSKKDTIQNETNNEPENNAEDIKSNVVEENFDKENSEKEKAYNELMDKFQRTLAEFDNFRKRTIKEKASMYDDGMRDTLEKFLPIIDNFGRAMTASEDKENSFYKGVEMILRQFNSLLTESGLSEILCVGETFDPNLHNAVMHVEDESFGENEVIEELQKGYKYKEKVLRPSMVKVAN